jgi:hypothetical protein
MAADVAWRRNPDANWRSWILGGMVVEIKTNGTLRIYHGYPDRNNHHCCNVASREHEKARAAFKSIKAEKHDLVLAFIEDEFPEITGEQRLDLLSEILDTMYSYDPGIGVNRPGRQS